MAQSAFYKSESEVMENKGISAFKVSCEGPFLAISSAFKEANPRGLFLPVL